MDLFRKKTKYVRRENLFAKAASYRSVVNKPYHHKLLGNYFNQKNLSLLSETSIT